MGAICQICYCAWKFSQRIPPELPPQVVKIVYNSIDPDRFITIAYNSIVFCFALYEVNFPGLERHEDNREWEDIINRISELQSHNTRVIAEVACAFMKAVACNWSVRDFYSKIQES